MKTENRFTPETIDECFSIPLYQRLFEWEEPQITGLLNDLEKSYDKEKPYYIGMLTATKDKDLVDGQQRFTVMMLMGIVFKNYWDEWKKFIKFNDNPRLRFKARPDDEAYLTSLINCKSNAIVNQKMKKGIECIQEWIAKFTDDTKKGFCQYVYNNLCFFISYLPDNYDGKALNKYFERMNTAGRNLENHEILKIRCLQALDSADKENATKIWNAVSQMDTDVCNINGNKNLKIITEGLKPSYSETENIQTIKQIIQLDKQPDKKEISSSHSNKILTFSEFLLLVLYIIVSKENENTLISDFNDANKLLTTFEKYTKDLDWKYFFKLLLKYRLLLDYFVISKPDKNQDYYELECGEDGNTYKKELIQYQAMLYADGQNPIWWTAEYFKKIEYLKDNPNDIHACNQLLKILKDIDNVKHKTLPKIENLNYSNHNLNYWLRLLDYYLWEENEEKDETDKTTDKAISNFKFRRGGMSKEHLHPQNQINEEPWKEGIDSFGNMFLISQSFNSSQSDDPVRVKFARIKEQYDENNIESIKLYMAYKECDDSKSKWTIEIMRKHEENMYKKLENIYHNK